MPGLIPDLVFASPVVRDVRRPPPPLVSPLRWPRTRPPLFLFQLQRSGRSASGQWPPPFARARDHALRPVDDPVQRQRPAAPSQRTSGFWLRASQTSVVCTVTYVYLLKDLEGLISARHDGRRTRWSIPRARRRLPRTLASALLVARDRQGSSLEVCHDGCEKAKTRATAAISAVITKAEAKPPKPSMSRLFQLALAAQQIFMLCSGTEQQEDDRTAFYMCPRCTECFKIVRRTIGQSRPNTHIAGKTRVESQISDLRSDVESDQAGCLITTTQCHLTVQLPSASDLDLDLDAVLHGSPAASTLYEDFHPEVLSMEIRVWRPRRCTAALVMVSPLLHSLLLHPSTLPPPSTLSFASPSFARVVRLCVSHLLRVAHLRVAHLRLRVAHLRLHVAHLRAARILPPSPPRRPPLHTSALPSICIAYLRVARLRLTHHLSGSSREPSLLPSSASASPASGSPAFTLPTCPPPPLGPPSRVAHLCLRVALLRHVAALGITLRLLHLVAALRSMCRPLPRPPLLWRTSCSARTSNSRGLGTASSPHPLPPPRSPSSCPPPLLRASRSFARAHATRAGGAPRPTAPLPHPGPLPRPLYVALLRSCARW
ncbi:uncharacterized protein BXZ73DRAFT_78334 [Epithele typhae]|uniref:uncharacterized protein n=1 Tax=Epithele typhae TaxID=378194 RepID=UPI0020083777|nr:uncharacterized protein BXZ73DRAFT_78334 [Epithele typhae]KAH9928528.1 hypothetical protein BXZ73DRAFT_78334 [Epithele typhae]